MSRRKRRVGDEPLVTRSAFFFLPLASLGAVAQNAGQDAKPTIAPEYYTRYGVLSFKSEGRQVAGTYPYQNGRITGKLEGNELKGTWRQSDGGGSIVITFSPDFSTFEARYNYAGTPDNWATGWSGTRKHEVQSREYETLWGVMKCDFQWNLQRFQPPPGQLVRVVRGNQEISEKIRVTSKINPSDQNLILRIMKDRSYQT
jgi:hypothetical protein